jgi:hypothetical protein
MGNPGNPLAPNDRHNNLRWWNSGNDKRFGRESPVRPTYPIVRTFKEEGPGWKRETTITEKDDFTEDVVKVTRFDDRRVTVETEHTENVVELVHGTPLLVPKRTDVSSETWHRDGSREISRQSSSWGESRPDIDPGGEASGARGHSMHTDSWEKVRVAPDGTVTGERGAETHSAAGQSRSTSETKADGTTVVTTTTTDNAGNGTRHTTVVNKSGDTVSDKPSP